PERVVLKRNIYRITVPTKEGEITVLPKHLPLVSILIPGVLEFVNENNEREVVSVSGGFVEVLRNKVVILADTAERAEELDSEQVEEARKKAEQMVRETKREDAERFAEISTSLAKELARSKAVKRWKKITRK
ncbi:MAG TPA: ATP synthase F1 subunit epsilon, partial [Patescibacteria group bacterium]|nr:ATP synthase F1 subunit epsilon [Patescibacteria group bacterium]